MSFPFKVSFENEAEWNLVSRFMRGAGVKEIWTAGRLCDSEVKLVIFFFVFFLNCSVFLALGRVSIKNKIEKPISRGHVRKRGGGGRGGYCPQHQ